MSKLSLKGNPSGTGNFSIEAPNSNVDRTLSLPDEAGTLATVENLPAGYTDTDALDLFNATGSAPVYACRAWVNFNGMGTVSVRDSGNVSSITDNGVGDYTVNFSTAMPDTNYSINGSASWDDITLNNSHGTAVSPNNESTTYQTSSVNIIIWYPVSANRFDSRYTNVTVFR